MDNKWQRIVVACLENKNTLVQFAQTLEENSSDILEMDLRLTSDGVPVVFHDASLTSRSICHGKIESKSYESLRKCTLYNGGWIPKFSDVLALVHGRKIISADLKTDSICHSGSKDSIVIIGNKLGIFSNRKFERQVLTHASS